MSQILRVQLGVSDVGSGLASCLGHVNYSSVGRRRGLEEKQKLLEKCKFSDPTPDLLNLQGAFNNILRNPFAPPNLRSPVKHRARGWGHEDLDLRVLYSFLVQLPAGYSFPATWNPVRT